MDAILLKEEVPIDCDNIRLLRGDAGSAPFLMVDHPIWHAVFTS